MTGPEPDVDCMLRLAAIIREVDGNHSKGAAALAEAILSHPNIGAALAAEPQGDSRLPEEAPPDHPPRCLDRRETAAWYHGHACGWQLARSVLASSEVQS